MGAVERKNRPKPAMLGIVLILVGVAPVSNLVQAESSGCYDITLEIRILEVIYKDDYWVPGLDKPIEIKPLSNFFIDILHFDELDPRSPRDKPRPYTEHAVTDNEGFITTKLHSCPKDGSLKGAIDDVMHYDEKYSFISGYRLLKFVDTRASVYDHIRQEKAADGNTVFITCYAYPKSRAIHEPPSKEPFYPPEDIIEEPIYPPLVSNFLSNCSIAYEDSFNDSSSGWRRNEYCQYVGGRYRLWLPYSKWAYWAWSPQYSKSADFAAEVDVIPDSSVDGAYGFIWGVGDNTYVFAVSTQGEYTLERHWDDQKHMRMIPWTADATIHRAGMNRLKLIVVGETITLTVNGMLLNSMTTENFGAVNIGLVSWTFDKPGFKVFFDNFRLFKPSVPLSIQLSLPKEAYSAGESIVITYTVNRAAYVYICDADASGKVTLLFPSYLEPNNYVSPGMHTLPSRSHYTLRVILPAGTDTLYAFAATSPLPNFPTSFRSSFPVLSYNPSIFRATVRQTMRTQLPAGEWAEDMLNFTVASAPTTGTLRVSSSLQGASVVIDGTPTGITPLQVSLRAGPHTGVLTRACYQWLCF